MPSPSSAPSTASTQQLSKAQVALFAQLFADFDSLSDEIKSANKDLRESLAELDSREARLRALRAEIIDRTTFEVRERAATEAAKSTNHQHKVASAPTTYNGIDTARPEARQPKAQATHNKIAPNEREFIFMSIGLIVGFSIGLSFFLIAR